MTTRYDVLSPRKKPDGGTYWHKVGAMFPSKSGDGYTVIFDSLPLPDAEGRVAVLARPPLERDGTRNSPARDTAPARRAYPAVLEDDIPF